MNRHEHVIEWPPGISSRTRLPDFVIIGSAKSGTGSLWKWLGQHVDVWLPAVKEPRLFSKERIRARDLESYARLFEPASTGVLTGEASVIYTDPEHNVRAARRIAHLLPAARLIFVARDPVERTRSAYRHQVQKHREEREFSEAIAESGNEYVSRSRYFNCLAPFIDLMPREQIRVVRMEDLVGPDQREWFSLLSFLGLSHMPRPDVIFNVTAERGRFTPTMRILYESGLHRVSRYAPSGVRRALKSRLVGNDRDYERLLRSSSADVPKGICEELAHEEELLWSWVDRSHD